MSVLRRLLILLGVIAIAIPIGCGPKEPCTVSPIDIEETKSDIVDLKITLDLAKERLGRAQAELAAWQKRYDDAKDQPATLAAELKRLKKASGRTEKKNDEQAQSTTEAAKNE